MAGFTVNQPVHMQGAGVGTAMLGPNVRARGQLGFLGTSQDALIFTNGTGFWTAPNVRTRVLGVFMVSQSSVGQAVAPGPSTVPVLVVGGDPRIRSL
jgi:hypothetical protein